jgi:hypothetical protein
MIRTVALESLLDRFSNQPRLRNLPAHVRLSFTLQLPTEFREIR